MKHIIKRTLSALLAVIILCSVCMTGVFALDTASDSDYYHGAFYYRPGTGEYDPGTEYVDYYTYSDEYFKHSGREYDPHLATLSFSLAVASVSSTREPFTEEGYRNKSRNVTAFLEDTGFSDIKINHDYTVKPTKDSLGIVCAHKQIIENGKEYTLLAVIPRSAGYEAEWGNNFVLGADGNAAGFDTCAQRCIDYANEYISEYGITGDIKVWSVGYSRGAAIANVIGGKLIDAPEALGESVVLSGDDLYVYTCGTPLAADTDNDPRNDKYACIFNHYLETEFASAMAPTDMGFDRYGVDFILYDEEKYDSMLDNLAVCNDYVHTTYKDQINSNQFFPKKIGITDGSVGMVDDSTSYIPKDPAEYLRGLCTHLTQITGGREEYAKTYEQPFSDLIAYYESLSSEQSAALTESITGNEDSIYMVAAMYAYFMNKKSDEKVVEEEPQPEPQQLRKKAEELASVAAGGEDVADTGIDETVIAKAALLLGAYLLSDTDTVKQEAAEYFSSVFADAMKASGATEEQIEAVTNKDASLALVHIISHLLLGNPWQSDNVYPLLLDNEQTKSAATLIGNAANLFVDHANEIIISWLKLYDSYYDDYAPMSDAQLSCYRRVYVKTSGAAVNGEIFDGNGTVIAAVENGRVKNSTDKWVGYTSTDDGGFFRIPADKDYKIMLNCPEKSDYSVAIGEYSVYDATTDMLYEKTVEAKEFDVIAIDLPALNEGYEIPSKAVYDIYVYQVEDVQFFGDADLNGVVDIVDAGLIRRCVAEMEELSNEQLTLSDVDSDGFVTVVDASWIQRYCAMMVLPGDIAVGKAVEL